VLILPGYGEVPPLPQGQSQATRGPIPGRARGPAGPARGPTGPARGPTGPGVGAFHWHRCPSPARQRGGTRSAAPTGRAGGGPSDCRVAGLPDRSACQLARRAAGRRRTRTVRPGNEPVRRGTAPARPSKEPLQLT
jgi:hypothetical protein